MHNEISQTKILLCFAAIVMKLHRNDPLGCIDVHLRFEILKMADIAMVIIKV
jgi:hypothetical protein